MKVGILGATGVVGREIIEVMQQRSFQCEDLRLFASNRSAGLSMRYGDRDLPVEEAYDGSFSGLDVVFSSAGSKVAKRYAPAILRGGATLIDNSSAFRMNHEVPLVVPEVNGNLITKKAKLIANPNCVAILLSLAVAPLHRHRQIRRLIVSTYQSASGAGKAAMQELQDQCADSVSGRQIVAKTLPHPLLFNVFSHNSAITANGYNGEEIKVIDETKKIMDAPELNISATCIRVPVLRAHSISVNLSFDAAIDEHTVREILENSAGVRVIDDRINNYFPMPIDASGRDCVLVGRIRRDLSQGAGNGIELFLVGDQLRKGAALNAVQIAEKQMGRSCN